MKRPSGSSFWLLAKCPASHALAQVAKDNDAADLGRRAHGVLEPVVLGCAPIPDGVSDLGLAMGEGSVAEAAFVYDVETGKVRFLGMGLEREYGELGPNEMAMTLDYLRIEEDRLVVRDWKFGESWLAPAAVHPQLRLCALVACRHFGKDRADIGWVKFDPEAFEADGSFVVVHHDHDELDVFDLDDVANEVRQAWRAWKEAVRLVQERRTPSVNQGDWCKWCPAYKSCPEKQSLARIMASPATAEEAIRALLPEERGKAYAVIIAAQQVLARARAEIETGVLETGEEVPLPDGRTLRVVQSRPRETVTDGALARRILAQVLGPEIAEDAFEYYGTKESIEKSIRKHKKHLQTSMAEANRVALAQLRVAKAVVSKPGKPKVEAVEERLALPAPGESDAA